MYSAFDHWAYWSQMLTVISMFLPCTQWVFGPLSPVSTLCAAYRPHFKTLLAVPPLYVWLIEQRRPAGTEDMLSVNFLISCVLFSLQSPITSSPSLVSLLKISFSPQNLFRSIVCFPLFHFVFFFHNFIPSRPGSHRSGQHPLLSATRELQPGRTFSHRRSDIICPTLKPLHSRRPPWLVLSTALPAPPILSLDTNPHTSVRTHPPACV